MPPTAPSAGGSISLKAEIRSLGGRTLVDPESGLPSSSRPLSGRGRIFQKSDVCLLGGMLTITETRLLTDDDEVSVVLKKSV